MSYGQMCWQNRAKQDGTFTCETYWTFQNGLYRDDEKCFEDEILSGAETHPSHTPPLAREHSLTLAKTIEYMKSRCSTLVKCKDIQQSNYTRELIINERYCPIV